MFDTLLPLARFSSTGEALLLVLLSFSLLCGLAGCVNLFAASPHFAKSTGWLLSVTVGLFVAGFALICWFHYQIHLKLPLVLPDKLATFLNNQLQAMNRQSAYGMPLYNAAAPPRYTIPVWIENEKYYFWVMSYAFMALIAHFRMPRHRFRAALHLGLAVQVLLLYFLADPFAQPLPRFFKEITPWFAGNLGPMQQFGLFMKLYPRMIFYYNADYMWFHPPLLFLSYACITLTFIASAFMLVKRRLEIEVLGYDFAKLGYFALTLGMLLGYPWALQAWGPNWWWDPKICSSIMLWAIFSTYLHTRLYANKKAMWYFSSILGILSFLAMIFTFLASFYFPGEHTFQ
ncbi:MAG: cytochrome c biogenesis protein CcsA [Deltaproteobacteria bacterium]